VWSCLVLKLHEPTDIVLLFLFIFLRLLFWNVLKTRIWSSNISHLIKIQPSLKTLKVFLPMSMLNFWLLMNLFLPKSCAIFDVFFICPDWHERHKRSSSYIFRCFMLLFSWALKYPHKVTYANYFSSACRLERGKSIMDILSKMW
jgi:hypothetical protein